MQLVIDVENTITVSEFESVSDGKKQPIQNLSPFQKSNKLVSIGVAIVPETVNGDIATDYFCFEHNAQSPTIGGKERVQAYLDAAKLLIGHNLKHDMCWLRSCGFSYDGDLYDTMIGEYVLQRGIRKPLSLEALSIEHELTQKKSDIIKEYLDKGVMFDAIPWDVVEEYGRGDCITTAELFMWQQREYQEKGNCGLVPTVRMMNAMLWEIILMNENGLTISAEVLSRLEKDTCDEYARLEADLISTCQQYMGDTPVDLNSPDFKSMFFFSRRPKDKAEWKKEFNIGVDAKGKILRRPRFSSSKFNRTVRALTDIIYRTAMETCSACGGTGKQVVYTKSGVPHKRPPKCLHCSGAGVVYADTKTVAGLKLIPRGVQDVSDTGFATNKELLTEFLESATPAQCEIITKFQRYTALSTYINTYIEGIRKYTLSKEEEVGLDVSATEGVIPEEEGETLSLHVNLNQTVAATGRLSSSSPNLQNQTRGGTFPIRRVFVSRWAKCGGVLLEADYGQLEFRVAGLLSGCPVVHKDIVAGVDVHAYTRDTINSFDPNLNQITRQDAKADTFKPLYGGQSGTPRQKHYYKSFLKKYHGVAEWHEKLKTEALTTKMVTIPSGRQYKFPYARRQPGGM